MSRDPSIVAIQFALELDNDDGMLFLKHWNEGNWSVIAKEWPECPRSAFVDNDIELSKLGEQELKVSGLQALLRERTNSWQTQNDYATSQGLALVGPEAFGINEVSNLLQKLGAGMHS